MLETERSILDNKLTLMLLVTNLANTKNLKND